MKKKGISKIISRRKKRLGRGYGSGKGGHTVGKGQKGQKTRKRLGILFEGVKVKKSLLKRLPFLRGKNKFKGGINPVILNLEDLNNFPSGTTVDKNFLIDQKIIERDVFSERGVKILGDGEITKKLVIAVPVSKSASEKVIKAGGKIEVTS